MNSLPDELPADGAEAFTGLVCPDCSGNLVVQRQADYVSFRCRVGHAYSVPELVASKEGMLEARLWAAVFAFEEMDSLMAGLVRHALARDLDEDACRQRSVLARRQAGRLREVIQADRPLVPPHDEVGGAVTTR